MAFAKEEEARWVMSFIEHSAKYRDDFEHIWQVTLENYLVRRDVFNANQQVKYPYLDNREITRSTTGAARLKDPESHQIVETLVANEMLQLFGTDDTFVRATPVGYEDASAARTVSGLTRHWMRLPGHHCTFHKWFKDEKIFGTGIVEGSWHYETRPDALTAVDDVYGVPEPQEVITELPWWDDYRLRCVDLFDFYPEPGKESISDMRGVAKRFMTTKMEAEANPRYDQAAVAKAVLNKNVTDGREREEKSWREGMDRSLVEKAPDEWTPLIGYVFYGRVPYKHPDGETWRRVEVIAGEVVRSERHVGRIPFFETTMSPIQGRFYGLSPLEVMIYTQDFVDGLLMLLADASARATHPSPMVDRNANVDTAKLKKQRYGLPIMTDRPNAVEYLRYDPPLAPAMNVFSSLKGQMREGGGVSGAFQGLGLGVDRASATEAAGTMQQAKGRPEANVMLKEREYLPPIAQHALKQYQRFLLDGEGLAKRIGVMPEPVPLETIHGEYDIEFIGSRQQGNKSERIQGYRELFSLAALPMVGPYPPWQEIIVRFMKEFGLHEEAQSSQMTIMQNLLMQQIQNQEFGNGNGETPRNPGALPAEQTAGGVIG